MKALFLTADLGGNVPPTLAVAAALARRGVDVEVGGLPPERSALTHVPFPPALAITPQGRGRGLREGGALGRLMAGRGTSDAAQALITACRADVVVADCMLPAVLRGALAAAPPVVALFHTFGAYWTRSFDGGPLGRMLGMRGLRPGVLWARAAARLLLTDRALDPGGGDPALADFDWTGTTETGIRAFPDRTRPRILVTLGSAEWPGTRAVYRRILDAVGGCTADVLVTTGGLDLGTGLPQAANVEVRGWMPHAEVLPTVDLVIGHGGHSTTMKTLAHGIPLLILPVNPTADQRMVGHAVQDAGAGRWVPKSAGAARIRSEVVAILEDDATRAHAAAIGARLRAAPAGAEVAADRILAVAAGRG